MWKCGHDRLAADRPDGHPGHTAAVVCGREGRRLMSMIDSMRAMSFEESSESKKSNSQCIAGNMAMIFADQIKKGVCTWDKVPLSLRPAVNSLLNRGE